MMKGGHLATLGADLKRNSILDFLVLPYRTVFLKV